MAYRFRSAVAGLALALSTVPTVASAAQPVPASVVRADATSGKDEAELRGAPGFGVIAVTIGVIVLITIVLVTRGGKSP